MENKITIEDFKRYQVIENQLYSMATEFKDTLIEVVPKDVDIWDMPRHHVFIKEIEPMGENIIFKYENLYDNTNTGNFRLNAEKFIENHIEYAKEFANEKVMEVMERERIAKANMAEFVKKQEMAEYERIKAKYNL